MSLTLGSRYTFVNTTAFPIFMDSEGMDQNHFVIVYARSSVVRIIAASVSGLTPTFGSTLALKTGGGYYGRTCRLDDDYVAVAVNNSSTNFTVRIIQRSGTVLTSGIDQGSFTGTVNKDVCALDDSKIVTVGAPSSPYRVYITAGTVNKVAKTVSFGSTVMVAGTKVKQICRVDNFNTTHGVIALNTGFGSIEQLLLFSVSGTTVTAGSFIDLTLDSGFDIQRAVDVACLSDTLVAVLTFARETVSGNWGYRVQIYTRSGLTLSLTASYSVYNATSLNFTITASIWAEKDKKGLYVIFNNENEPKILVRGWSVSGSILTVTDDNTVVEDLTGASGNQYVSGCAFSGANSNALIYNYLLTNYISAVKIGNATFGSFTPKTSLI